MATDFTRAIELVGQGELLAAGSILEAARAAGEVVPLATMLACSQGFLIYDSPRKAVTWLERAVQLAARDGDPGNLNLALGWLGLACLACGLEDRVMAIREMTRHEDWLAVSSLLLFQARWLATHSDREAAGRLYNEALARKDLATLEAVPLLLERGCWYYSGADFAAAGRDWQRAAQLAGLLGDHLLLAWCRQVTRSSRHLKGDLSPTGNRPAGTFPCLYFYLLGEFAVRRGEEMLAVHTWPRRKAIAILQYLALQPHWRVARNKLVEILWGEDAGTNVLHVTLHTLRRALNAGLEKAPAYLVLQQGHIGLQPELVAGSDLQQFRACIQAARVHWGEDRPRALECYRQAKSLYGGELLAGAADEIWLATLREGVRQMYLEALARLAAAAGREGDGLALWLEVLDLDPGNEEALEKVIRLLARNGRKNRALEYYQRYARYLVTALGVEPAPELQQLYRQLKQIPEGEQYEPPDNHHGRTAPQYSSR
ncbi:MAG: hypothetical protein PWP70_1440 [Moorella sp. (in: firmicutes)]|nr:hypothetical protein [Moorella sp. (in: firmicutes)]